jgi:hypothetical protein
MPWRGRGPFRPLDGRLDRHNRNKTARTCAGGGPTVSRPLTVPSRDYGTVTGAEGDCALWCAGGGGDRAVESRPGNEPGSLTRLSLATPTCHRQAQWFVPSGTIAATDSSCSRDICKKDVVMHTKDVFVILRWPAQAGYPRYSFATGPHANEIQTPSRTPPDLLDDHGGRGDDRAPQRRGRRGVDQRARSGFEQIRVARSEPWWRGGTRTTSRHRA